MVIRRRDMFTLATGKIMGESYKIGLNVHEVYKIKSKILIAARATKNHDIKLWQKHLGHLNSNILTQLSKQSLISLLLPKSRKSKEYVRIPCINEIVKQTQF